MSGKFLKISRMDLRIAKVSKTMRVPPCDREFSLYLEQLNNYGGDDSRVSPVYEKLLEKAMDSHVSYF